MLPEACPSEVQLQAFQLGDLAEPSLSDVARHLEKCAHCETMAQRLDTAVDPILAALRQPAAANPKGATRIIGPAPLTGLPQSLRAVEPRPYPFLQPALEPTELGRLGSYRVLRLLGHGGMAFVFQAEDLALHRAVALKVMKPELQQDADGLQRFLREARLLASIRHENLVTIYQAGQEGQAVYLAMELLAGESLGSRLDRTGPMDLAELLRLGRGIADGLQVVHGHGLVHRDIKPDNIWLEEPSARVKLLDFGLARPVTDKERLTRSGTVMGTPAYMAPEQARGLAVDARADLFSLGCVLYALAVGRSPFHGPDTLAILSALAVEDPRPLDEMNPKMPPQLADLVRRLLAKRPADRPDSAAAVLVELQQLEAQLAHLSAPSSWRKVLQWSRRLWQRCAVSRRGLVQSGLVAIALAAVAFAMLKSQVQEGPGGDPAPEVYGPVLGAQYLSELAESGATNWPFPGHVPGVPRDEPADWPAPRGGYRVWVQGKASVHGIWTHQPPEGGPVQIRYELRKQYSRFQASVSLNDGPRDCAPLTFAVYGDDKLLWESEPVTSQADTQSCSLSVRGVEQLKLEVRTTGPEKGTHGVWIEPYVTK